MGYHRPVNAMGEERDTRRHLVKNDLLFVDFDGTISLIDTGIAVIDALDLDEAWELEHQWRRGEIPAAEVVVQLTPKVRIVFMTFSPADLDGNG